MSQRPKTQHIDKVIDLISELGISNAALLTAAHNLGITLIIENPRWDAITFIMGISTRKILQKIGSIDSFWPYKEDRPIRLAEHIEYFEIRSVDYFELVQKNKIRRSKFTKVIEFTENLETIALDTTEYTNKYAPASIPIRYLEGSFVTFKRTPKNLNLRHSLPESEYPISIKMDDLLIRSNDAATISGNFTPTPKGMPWLSKKLGALNALHLELFGAKATYQGSRKQIENEIREKLNIRNNKDALIREATYAILPDTLYQSQNSVIIPDHIDRPEYCNKLHSTLLIATNCAALELWKLKNSSEQGTYPKQDTITELLKKMNLTGNFSRNIQSIIRPESESRTNKKKHRSNTYKN